MGQLNQMLWPSLKKTPTTDFPSSKVPQKAVDLPGIKPYYEEEKKLLFMK